MEGVEVKAQDQVALPYRHLCRSGGYVMDEDVFFRYLTCDEVEESGIPVVQDQPDIALTCHTEEMIHGHAAADGVSVRLGVCNDHRTCCVSDQTHERVYIAWVDVFHVLDCFLTTAKIQNYIAIHK